MLRIAAETAYPLTAPSARVRLAEFAPFLYQHGVALDYSPTLTDTEYALLSSGASTLRKSLILASAAARAARTRKRDSTPLLIHRLRFLTPLPFYDPPRHLDVYDFDDALFLGTTPGTNRRFRWAKQEARRWATYARRSQLVIAGNSFLADHARHHAQRIEVVPSCVDPTRQQVRIHRESDVARVGWIGSHTTSPYLLSILPVMERLNRNRLRAKLVLVGADQAITAPWIDHRPWSLTTEHEALASFDIGIMPLPNSPWAQGKCGYKVLRYFAAGVPVVASPVGVAPSLIGQRRGLLATSHEDWHAALTELIGDVQGRRERGLNARWFAEDSYSYDRWAPQLADLLSSLPQ